MEGPKSNGHICGVLFGGVFGVLRGAVQGVCVGVRVLLLAPPKVPRRHAVCSGQLFPATSVAL